jgi:hypothetical protein
MPVNSLYKCTCPRKRCIRYQNCKECIAYHNKGDKPLPRCLRMKKSLYTGLRNKP